MPVELFTFKSLWPIASRLPGVFGLLFRWYFSASRLASLVYVDLFPRDESARVDLAGTANFRLYLQIINLSPFKIEIDRAEVDFVCAGVTLKGLVLKRQQLSAGDMLSLPVSGQVSTEQAAQIAQQRQLNTSSLQGNIEFNCQVRSFARPIQHLSGVHVTFINAPATRGA